MKRKTTLVYLGMGCMTLLGLMVWAAQEKKPLDTKERKQMHTVVREIHEEVMKHGLDALKKSVAVLEKRQNEAKAKGKTDEVAVLEEAEVRIRANVKQWSLHAKVYPLREKNKEIIKEKGRSKEAKEEALKNYNAMIAIYKRNKKALPDQFHASLDLAQMTKQKAHLLKELDKKDEAKRELQNALKETQLAIKAFEEDPKSYAHPEHNVGQMIYYNKARQLEALYDLENNTKKKLELAKQALEAYAEGQRKYEKDCDAACAFAYHAQIQRVHKLIRDAKQK